MEPWTKPCGPLVVSFWLIPKSVQTNPPRTDSASTRSCGQREAGAPRGLIAADHLPGPAALRAPGRLSARRTAGGRGLVFILVGAPGHRSPVEKRGGWAFWWLGCWTWTWKNGDHLLKKRVEVDKELKGPEIDALALTISGLPSFLLIHLVAAVKHVHFQGSTIGHTPKKT